jgi:phospholipid/cholesterol/gamma-HCH transport system permease protein
VVGTKSQTINANDTGTQFPEAPAQSEGMPAGGNLLSSCLARFGELGIFCWQLALAVVTPPYELGELIHQCDEVGSKSLPLVALAGAATGVVMSLQTRSGLIRFGGKSLIPLILMLSIIKESGPTMEPSH